MEDESKTSWTGWFMLALVLSFLHLAILLPLFSALSVSNPWIPNIAFSFGASGGEMGILVNSLIYGVLATVAIYFWRSRRPPA